MLRLWSDDLYPDCVPMPAYPHIDRYYGELTELIEFGGLANEENIRSAFQNCLAAYCAEHSERFVLVPELRSGS